MATTPVIQGDKEKPAKTVMFNKDGICEATRRRISGRASRPVTAHNTIAQMSATGRSLREQRRRHARASASGAPRQSRESSLERRTTVVDSDLAEAIAALKAIFEKRFIPAHFGKSDSSTVDALRQSLPITDRYASFLVNADPLDVETATPPERIRFVPGSDLEHEQRVMVDGDEKEPWTNPLMDTKTGWTPEQFFSPQLKGAKAKLQLAPPVVLGAEWERRHIQPKWRWQHQIHHPEDHEGAWVRSQRRRAPLGWFVSCR